MDTHFMPKHIRGPREKAINQLSSSLDASQRSGVNVSGSGKMEAL
jgi:hypothetical protein